MNKIFLVIQREYLTRVKKKSFWILTLLVPILLVALYAIPIYLSLNSLEVTNVAVVDETSMYGDFVSTDDVNYFYYDDTTAAKEALYSDSIDAFVYVPKTISGKLPTDVSVYYYKEAPSASVKSDIEEQLQGMLRNSILVNVYEITPDDYDLITNTSVHMIVEDLETGEKDFVEIKMMIGLILSLLIYISIFMFGSQVMRGVMEEKTNRIVEVMVSSLRPFQLMMGKVIGVALVGLTQFALWIVLSGGLISAFTMANADKFAGAQTEQITSIATKGQEAVDQTAVAMPELSESQEMIQGLMNIQFSTIILSFLIFFVLGYFLYATLFAAVGSITESETDNSQFVLPLTVPLLLSIILMPSMVNAPNGSLAVWLSMIPFTSPVAMMVRLPFGIPIWQVVVSIGILVVTFLISLWVAAKIYRTGILLYGKKITYKELWKWLRFKN